MIFPPRIGPFAIVSRMSLSSSYTTRNYTGSSGVPKNGYQMFCGSKNLLNVFHNLEKKLYCKLLLLACSERAIATSVQVISGVPFTMHATDIGLTNGVPALHAPLVRALLVACGTHATCMCVTSGMLAARHS